MMTTNAGVLVTKKKCDIPNLGTYWFNEKAITNIISLKDMVKQYQVTFDSEQERAMIVHFPKKIVKFQQLNSGLYGMNPKDKNNKIDLSHKISLVNTVEDNLKFLSPRQRDRAKIARKVSEALGTPSCQDMKAMIRMNLIRGIQVTTKDVDLAEKAFGPDLGAVKGKKTRQLPNLIDDHRIEIPEELLSLHKDITISIDGMKFNSLPFLTSISHDICYRTAQYLMDGTAKTFQQCIDEILGIYKKGGFQVRTIHCENEFHAALDIYAAQQQPPIIVKYSASQEHVPHAERNNITIKE